MTGICGIWHQNGKPGAIGKCARMQRALAIYGSDRQGQWDGGDIAFGIGLAHLVPEDIYDRQPLTGGGGRFHLLADVRLDNRPELAALLGIPPGKANVMADSGFVLAAWERWQEGCMDKLIGDFAIAVWDTAQHRLYLARDPLGRRPLFYHHARRWLAFASMAKGLHALPDIPIAPDLDTLRDHLALAPKRGSASYFKEIHRVEPGGLVTVHSDGHIETSEWYEWRLDRQTRFRDDREYVEAFRSIFDRAVADRLRTTGPIATELSGGFDSTAVTATAAQILAQQGKTLTAYTHVPLPGVPLDEPKGRFADEWPLAAKVAERYPNIEHIRVDAADRQIGDDLDAYFYYFECPARSLCNRVWASEIKQLSSKRKEKVLLSGTMGNATLSQAGLQRLPELIRTGQVLTWYREAHALIRRGHSAKSALSLTFLPLLPPRMVQLLRKATGRNVHHLPDYSALRPEIIASKQFRERMTALDFDSSYAPWGDVRKMSAFIIRRIDPGHMIKGIVGAYGIDARDPTADRRLFEFTLSLPSEMFLRNGQTKWIYRQAFANRIPAEILDQRRKGYQTADWLERFKRHGHILHAEAERSFGGAGATQLLDIDALKRLLATAPPETSGGRVTAEYRLKLFRAIAAVHFLRKTEKANS